MTARRDPAAGAAGTVLFAGGGSGGHVFPALAVAEELAARGWGIAFTGTAGGMEEGLVERAGWPFEALPARPLVGKSPVAQARALAVVGRSTLGARRIVRRLGAAAVVGTGGYVSAPAVLGARLAGRPALLVEPNAEAGLANRWLSRWAEGAAVAFAETGARFHCPSWVTGVPVRRAFFELPERPPERPRPGGGGPHLLVLGGSQGARQLNRDLPAALAGAAGEGATEIPGLTILHQAGRNRVDETAAAYRQAGFPVGAGETVEVADFLPDVALQMGAADLVVSRAGAITIAEICAAGRASLLAPLALAGGHQQGNARRMAEAGAAVVVASDAAPERLGAALRGLLGDPGRLAAMGRAARALARPGAASAIADRVEALAHREAA